MDSEKHKRIERRAYTFWEAEGQPHGKHEEHWVLAAREIEAEERPSNPEKRKPKRGSASPARKKKK